MLVNSYSEPFGFRKVVPRSIRFLCLFNFVTLVIGLRTLLLKGTSSFTSEIHGRHTGCFATGFFSFLQILGARVFGKGSVDFYETRRLDTCLSEPYWKCFILMTLFLFLGYWRLSDLWRVCLSIDLLLNCKKILSSYFQVW